MFGILSGVCAAQSSGRCGAHNFFKLVRRCQCETPSDADSSRIYESDLRMNLTFENMFNTIKMDENIKKYYCYWIVSGRSSYIGATVNPTKRLKQHCGIIVGGARRTRGRLWTYKCVISGFRTWQEALMYEWSFKYHSRHCRGIESRQLALEKLMQKERWTKNSPLASEIPLNVEYDPIQYGFPPDELPTQKQRHRKAISNKQTSKTDTKKNKWKKHLLGVKY